MKLSKILLRHAVWALSASILFAGCSTVSEPAAKFTPPDWVGSWQGIQPEYPMKDAGGNVIYIQGQAAQVKSSTFIFVLQPYGKRSFAHAIHGRTVASWNFKGGGTPFEAMTSSNPRKRARSTAQL